MLFLTIESSETQYAMFLLNEKTITKQNYYYYLYEHVGAIIPAVIFYFDNKRFRIAFLCYIFAEVGDMIDFACTYNEQWWSYHGIPVTYNIVKILIFSMGFVMAVINDANDE